MAQPCEDHATCKACGLFRQTALTPFMQPRGKGDLLVVGDFPRSSEDKTGDVFTGPLASMLLASFKKANIDPKRCRFVTAARCRPKDDKMKGVTAYTHCRSFLEAEVASCKPKAILLLGNGALVGLLKRSGITKQRRTRFNYTQGGVSIPVVAALHPANVRVMRDLQSEFDADIKFFSALIDEVDGTVSTARDTKGIDILNSVHVNMYPTLDDLKAFREKVLKSRSKLIGVDVEADTDRPLVMADTFGMLCIGMSDGKDALVLRVDEPVNGDATIPCVRYENFADHAKLHELTLKLGIIKSLLVDCRVRKIAHNGKYDSHAFYARFKWIISNFWLDTFVAHAFLWPVEGVKHDLDSVVSSLLGAWKYKHITEQWVGEGTDPARFRTVPYDKLALRNGLDCWVLPHLIKPLAAEMKRADMEWEKTAAIKRTKPSYLFRNMTMVTARNLIEVERRGMQVDVKYAHELKQTLGNTARIALSTMRALPQVQALENKARTRVVLDANAKKRPPKPDILKRRMLECAFTAKPREIVSVLFDHFNLPMSADYVQFTKEKQVSTSAEALEAYRLYAEKRLGNTLAGEFIKNVNVYREATKGESTFVDGILYYVDARGRVHGSFNQITRTGRLSSSEPNMQNIPRGSAYRKLFIARPGYKLISADYSQIELRVLAALGNDPVMKAIFESGRDLHEETARRVFAVQSGVPVDKEQRVAAKAVNFGNVYGQTARGLALSLGCSERMADSYQRAVMGEFKGAARWIAQSKAFARKYGYVFTWFGRRRQIGNAQITSDAEAYLVGHAERVAVNTPVQGTANEICLIAFNYLSNYFDSIAPKPYCEVVELVHDQLIFECEESRVQEAKAIIEEKCVTVPMAALGKEFTIPIKVDMSVGTSWGELE